MTHKFTRKELYDLVWAEPMYILASKYKISGNGLAKACKKANIPVPQRGYWNKLNVGKKVNKTALPARGIGMNDYIIIGKGSNYWYHDSYKDILKMEIPTRPTFEPDIDNIVEQVKVMVHKAPMPKTLANPHILIAKMLANDKAAIEYNIGIQYSFQRKAVIFDNPFEQRRLRILNTLFTCLTSCGMKPYIRGNTARDIYVTVGEHNVSITLDSTTAKKQIERERSGYDFTQRGARDTMELVINAWYENERGAWQDCGDNHIEDHLREIAIAIIVAGEKSYRSGELYRWEQLIEAKANAEEKERKRLADEERKRLEHIAEMEKRKLDHLLNQVKTREQAQQIRAYVNDVKVANKFSKSPISDNELISWASWALERADIIDPITSGEFSKKPAE